MNDPVKDALRLTDAAYEKLFEEIQRNKDTARAEMIRVGISKDISNGDSELVTEAIVTYCQMKMGRPDYYDRYREAWEYMIDSIRKSQSKFNSQENDNESTE